MATDKAGIYQRGGFWLDYVRGAGGHPASDRLYIWWYDSARGRQRRKTTGTSDVRAACTKLDEHYLATLNPSAADRAVYDVPTALVDYYIEAGSKRPSADAIKARLGHVTRFIEREVAAGRLVDPVMPDRIDEAFLTRFREWLTAEPITARKKDANGCWTAGKQRARSIATVEESVIQLKAALNHAAAAGRIDRAPTLKHRTRGEVSSARAERMTVAQIGELLDYTMRGAGKYGGHAARLLPLRRYVIAAITTLARPDAILDMSTAAARRQWLRDDRRFALNPAGRVQTKKHRPIVPVPELLDGWLDTTEEWFICREVERFDEAQQIVVTRQLAVASIRSAWDTARSELRLPEGWGPKLLRHSMATELRRRRVDPWELSGQLGHRVLRTSEIYAAFDPDYLGTVTAGIEDVIADLRGCAKTALHPKVTQKPGNVTALRA